MIPFEHTGPERTGIRWSRNLVVGTFLTIGAILLFPLTLLMLFLRVLGYLANPRVASG
jgi:hypothetical protein